MVGMMSVFHICIVLVGLWYCYSIIGRLCFGVENVPDGGFFVNPLNIEIREFSRWGDGGIGVI